MKLTDDQIRSIMVKESSSKTILVDRKDKEEIVNKHQKDGWKLHKEADINEKVKLTFIK